MRAPMLLAHGSPDPSACAELRELRDLVESRLDTTVALGVLEFPAAGLPAIEDAFAGVVPSTAVAVQPLILFDGLHGRHDVPRITQEASAARGLEIEVGSSLGQDGALVELAASRLAELALGDGDVLLFVGRGSSEPIALSQAVAVAAAVAGAVGVGHVICYAGISRPDLAEGMAAALERPARRVVALPYLLHTGVLVRCVEEILRPLARQAGTELLVLPHIGNCPALVDLVAGRLEAMR